MSDRLGGIKEEIAGKITHNQDKVQHGKEMRTGELKRKKLEESEVCYRTWSMCLH